MDESNESLYIYTKEHAGETLLVVCNFSKEQTDWKLPEEYATTVRIFGNFDETSLQGGKVELRPYEAVVYKVSA